MSDFPAQTPLDSTPASPAEYLRQLQQRLLAGDPNAPRDIDRIAWLSNLEALTDELQRAGALREHQFTSALPVVGRLIAAVRSLLYRWTAGWPMRTLIAQQTRVNRDVARALTESLALNRRLLQRLEQLEARVAELEREHHQ
ncbi:MAG: hypothetical protein ACUVR3_12675 [Candidatus Roseilinea sp.]|uniref:hypothetical protein n=1 Tax=Candidatus Roseilinea sp. TaxID=2838777 RepID=UPI00404909F8